MRNISKIYIKLIILITISSFFVKCVNSKGEDLYVLDIDSNSADLTTTVGNTLMIRVKGNPTTGYSWFLSNHEEIDQSVLELVNIDERGASKTYEQDDHPKGFVGVGGSYIFKFNALKAEKSVLLKFVYKRPWEKDNDRVIDVKVEINKN